jgi:hypothetical protein
MATKMIPAIATKPMAPKMKNHGGRPATNKATSSGHVIHDAHAPLHPSMKHKARGATDGSGSPHRREDSTRLWSEEVRRAEAMDAMETAQVPFPVEVREDAYRFTGRTFKRRKDPYA